MEVEKERGEPGKGVVIADQPELKVTVIFALLILVALHKKDLALQPLKWFEELRFCSWKSLPLLSPIPIEDTTDNPLFRALAWDSGDQSSVLIATDVLADPWQVI